MAEDNIAPTEFVDLLNVALTEMTDEQLIEELRKLRDRRAQARERRVVERSAAEQGTKRKKPSNEITGKLGSALDDIFNDDVVVCEKCGSRMDEGVCGNPVCD
jgi:hypothetical protein